MTKPKRPRQKLDQPMPIFDAVAEALDFSPKEIEAMILRGVELTLQDKMDDQREDFGGATSNNANTELYGASLAYRDLLKSSGIVDLDESQRHIAEQLEQKPD